MTAKHPVPPELADLAGDLAEAIAGRLQTPMAMLAELLGDRVNVRNVPSDDFAGDYLSLLAANQVTQIIGRDLTRVRIEITNLGPSNSTLWLGNSPQIIAGTGSYPLKGGSSVVLATTAPIFGVTTDATVQVAWLAEVWNNS